MSRFVPDGKLYGWDTPALRLQAVRQTCALFAGISLILSIFFGCLPTGVARDKWVSFGGTAALLALMLMLIALVRFCLVRSQLDYRTFHSIHIMMDYAPLFHCILMTLALAAGIISCIRAYTGPLDLLALLLTALAAGSSWLFRRAYRSLPVYTMRESDI